MTGESSTRSICDSGTSTGVETTSRGAAVASSGMDNAAVKRVKNVFINQSR